MEALGPQSPATAAPAPETLSPQRRSESTPAYILLGILMWMIFWPDSGSSVLPVGDVGMMRFEHERYALQVLQNATWGAFAPRTETPLLQAREDKQDEENSDAGNQTEEERYIGAQLGYLNLTGFRRGDNYSWEGLTEFRHRCDARHRDASLSFDSAEDTWTPRGVPVWHNMSGVVSGEWSVTPMPGARQAATDFNLTKLVPFVDWQERDDGWAWNMTGSKKGSLKMTFHDGISRATGVFPDTEEFKDVDPETAKKYRVNYLASSMSFEDDGRNYEMWDMSLYGLHWPESGMALLSTTSDKFDGIFGLPLLAPTKEMFLSGRHALNASIIHRLEAKENELFADPRIPWIADDYANAYTPTPQCEYLMFLQLLPPDKDKFLQGRPREAAREIFEDLERELRFPIGAPVPAIPKLQMAMTVFSPDCGFYMESVGPPEVPLAEGHHLSGFKSPVVRAQVNTIMLGMFTAMTVQFLLLKRQMRQSSTPSTIGRVSFLTICAMAIADSLIAMFCVVFLMNPQCLITAVALVFSAIMCSVMAAVFLFKIFNTQLSDRLRERERERAAALAANPPPQPAPQATPLVANETAPSAHVSPPVSPTHGHASDDEHESAALLPTVHRPNSPPPIIVTSDQDIDAEIAQQLAPPPTVADNPSVPADPTTSLTFYNLTHVTRCLIFLAFGISIIMLSTFAQRRSVRAFTYYVLSILYFSFWLPQVYRNVWRNSRRALSWEFMIGQSVMRLIPIGYLYAVEDNAFLLYTDRKWFMILCGWVTFQLVLLAFQDLFGPRVAVPKSWFPEGWDYHPILCEDGLESGPLPIGIAEAPRRTVRSESSSSAASINSNTPLVAGEALGRHRTDVIRVMDCAICCEDLEVPVLPMGVKDVSGVAGVFARRAYMVTPCGHVFHTGCLENWMRLRLQCPNCREDIPPL